MAHRGHVFVSYARADLVTAEALVRYLAKDQGFEVWWDQEIDPGAPWRYVIEEKLAQAAAVLVLFTANSAISDWVLSEADRANSRRVMVPVRSLPALERLPSPYDQIQSVDISGWTGGSHPGLEKLVAHIHKRLEENTKTLVQETPKPMNAYGLIGNTWATESSADAVTALQNLTSRTFLLGEVLTLEASPAQDLRRTLEEVHRTYRAVNAAIESFIAPALTQGDIDAAPFVAMERGNLVSSIYNGRGHCSRIATYYGRFGGLRDFIKNRLESNELAALDSAFAQLSTADGDAFARLALIGDVLTTEAREIVDLLRQRKQEEARHRIMEGRKQLRPLEDKLSSAMRELQDQEASIGYAEGV